MDEFKKLFRRAVFIAISAAVFMPAGAIIYKTRADEIMRDRFEKQEIGLVKLKHLESEAWKKLQVYIKEANFESEKILIMQEIMGNKTNLIDEK